MVPSVYPLRRVDAEIKKVRTLTLTHTHARARAHMEIYCGALGMETRFLDLIKTLIWVKVSAYRRKKKKKERFWQEFINR